MTEDSQMVPTKCKCNCKQVILSLLRYLNLVDNSSLSLFLDGYFGYSTKVNEAEKIFTEFT